MSIQQLLEMAGPELALQETGAHSVDSAVANGQRIWVLADFSEQPNEKT